MNFFPDPPAPRRNLAEEITVQLRQEIVSGKIAPGTPLAEPVLAERFGASRAPIREALIALEREGLVEFNERSRTRVRPLTVADFEEICTMRMALEGLAARLAAQHWTAADTAAIEENLRRQERAATLGELSRLDVEMHEFVVRHSGHRRLIAAWRGIRWQFEMCLAYTHRLQEKLAFEPRRITVDSHRRLLAALASGKPQLAESTMAAHIKGSLEWSLAKFPSDAPAPAGKNGRRRTAAKVAKIVLLFLAGLASARAEIAPADAAFFDREVRPVLVERCYECHSHDKKIKGGLVLDSRSGWEKGGDSGPAIVPGKPEESLLIRAVGHLDKDLAMPPKKKLGDAEIATLTEWVKRGAPDPREITAHIGGMTLPEAKAWWAFQPLPPAAPEPAASAKIDEFLRAKLRPAGRDLAPAADKRTLLRRVTFDLIGLPPTPEEVAAFVADDSPGAFSQVVDRLLASPRYGERWARHWLDVARYADSWDTRGFGTDGDMADAWRYRDWVVQSFNRDLPYDEFIRQQVAGDVLAPPNGPTYNPDSLIATGLYAIGTWGNGDSDKEKTHTDIVDDQIDVTGRAFLGLTLACARCHDHKFDPITTADYYSLAGIFFSSRILDKFAAKTAGEKLMRVPLLTPEEQAQHATIQKRIGEIDAQLANGLLPFTEVKDKVAGRVGLIGWLAKGTDNPSLTINTTESEAVFSTIHLPARAIAVHPGPKTSVTAAWRSPIEGTVKVSVRLRDLDPNCGDGVEWAVRVGDKTLGSGTLENGKGAEFGYTDAAVAKADLLQLVIRPRANYTCDTTQIDLTVQALDGTKWDLREALLAGAQQGHEDLWWICAGEGAKLTKDTTGLATLEAERKDLTAKLKAPPSCHGLREGGIPQTAYEGFHDARIHVRGRYDRLGDTVPRGFPAILAGDKQPPIAGGSGRLELARWLSSPQNPLPARVMVNRIWQHHFGEGLVRTPNNFGKLGTPPTHPELLDWLASEFIKSGWSIKAMHRLIVNSAAYQQTSGTASDDPDNRLFGHQNRRRLEAESLRDAMLQAAGDLDLQAGGVSVRDLSATRRTLYVTTIRADRATYQSLFDAADPTAIVEKRIESTVAPQALWLMNHPFVLAQAKTLATRARQQAAGDETRVRWLYETLYSRPPAPREIALGEKAVAAGDDVAWESYCQVLLCANEFIYLD